MTRPARLWAVDFHVHTPGSQDVRDENYGTASEIVSAAISAGIDAIAITDHNTAAWCDAMQIAAADTDLVVLPGVEISTTEGHLLGIWEEGTSSTVIEDVLTVLGIRTRDRGKLDIAANCGIADAAKQVAEAGGVAIAAHVDKPKGLLTGISVAAHQKRTLLEPSLAAVEVVDLSTRATVNGKLGGERTLAFVQGSDTWDSSLSRHSLTGIGARRTWVKSSRPDLVGIRHALVDPDLRVRLGNAPSAPAYPVINSVELIGGFLAGEKVTLCPDLNCLLGGTGAGKSLVLEAIRYALDQQVDAKAFPAIHQEVQSRLQAALDAGLVRLHATAGGYRYRVERPFIASTSPASPSPTICQETGDEWIPINTAARDLITLAAFSQGEVLEYSRRPVGRMSLVDAGIDVSGVQAQIADLTRRAAENGSRLIAARKRVAALRQTVGKQTELDQQVRKLSALFDTQVVKQQAGWASEGSKLTKAAHALSALATPVVKFPSLPSLHDVDDNADLFVQASSVLQLLGTRVQAATEEITAAISQASQALATVQSQWETRHKHFLARLDTELGDMDGQSSLTSLRIHLRDLQQELAEVTAASEELTGDAFPELEVLEEQREELIGLLHDARKRRRELRRDRAAELNKKMAGFVRIDVPNEGDFEDYRKALDTIKVGSRVRDNVLDAIARTTHPTKFARLLWHAQLDDLADDDKGIDSASIARLYANIDEKNLWESLLELQFIDRPDILTVKFKKPDNGAYTPIENLAHGQRCTAILIILLADGDTPVVVDQPEDALHAPWIEEYLVDRLRALRGSRQYLFATRSPGIVVSGDAEQIITMRATAGRGELEASGSLERHDLNRLALYHLEGGPIPFRRRTRKLAVSTES